ncbi:MAG: hypothetical protein K0R81_129 [Microbacterium sp.]|jgi:hypothetical protein|nr:hypothetical protein [Microbacterium sp.]
MESGEHWAYRARSIDPLVEVEVKRVGTQKPARVLVLFVGDDAEGREDWVPPARLKVPWSEVGEFMAREARWDAVDTHPGLRDAPEEYAVDQVMRTLIDESLAAPVYRYPGVTSIVDLQGLARRLLLDEADLRAEPAAFEEDGALLVPWATTEQIVRRACELFPESILCEVEEEEAKARQEAMHGERITSSGRGGRSFYIEPEQAAKWDAEQPYGKPTRELLRRWCGQDAIDRHDELMALREEVVRVDVLLSEAIRTLREAGLKEQAVSLERRFGVPLNEARESRR